MKAITGAGNLSVSPKDEKLSIQEKAMTTLDMLVQRNQEFASAFPRKGIDNVVD